MKKFLSLIISFFFISQAQAVETYKFDPNHTNITWFANHFGFSNPSGKFTETEGKIILDRANPKKSSVEITIKTASISTGLAKFDNHLKSTDFFNVEKFPTATFVSTEVIPNGQNKATVKGDLTLLGVTNPVILNVKLNKTGINPLYQVKTVGFSASTTIKRSTFGIDYAIPGVSDVVKIAIEAEGNLDSSDEITETATINSPKSNLAAINKKDSLNPEWKIIPQNSYIAFKANQENSEIKGHFKKLGGQINFDKNATKGNKVLVEVDTNSVSIPFADALEVLKTEPWLSTTAFSKATFTAEKFTSLGEKEMKAEGFLTIKGKSLPINFYFKFDEYSKTKAVASGSFKIKRTDFDVGNKDLKKANGINDEVQIGFSITAEKK